jgi:hypothetical protein
VHYLVGCNGCTRGGESALRLCLESSAIEAIRENWLQVNEEEGAGAGGWDLQ